MKITIGKLKAVIAEAITPPRRAPNFPSRGVKPRDAYKDFISGHTSIVNEFEAAVEEFASGFEGLGHDGGDAPDAAEGFFASYPQWESWAVELDMSEEEMKSVVTDMIADAMSR